MTPFEVSISPQLRTQVEQCLGELNVQPTPVKSEQSDQPVSLLSSHVLDDFHPAKPTMAGVVPWSPPQPNWNCWTGCNIDEGYLATASLEDLSEQMLTEAKERANRNPDVQKSMVDRKKLPVYDMKGVIMEAINEHPVIIIRGNTGCGKFENASNVTRRYAIPFFL